MNAMMRCVMRTKKTSCRGPGERARHVEDLLLLQQFVADATGRADKLRHHDHARGVAEVDLPGSENVGKDRRQDHRAQHLDARRSQRHHHLDQILRHPAQRIEHLEREGRQRRHRHDEEDARLGAVEPDDRENHPRQRWYPLKEIQDWREKAICRAKPQHHGRDCGAGHERADQARENPSDGRQYFGEQRPARKDRDDVREHVDERGKQIFRKVERCDLPEQPRAARMARELRHARMKAGRCVRLVVAGAIFRFLLRLIDARFRGIGSEEPDGSAGRVDRLDFLAHVGGPAHVQPEPLVRPDQVRLSISGRRPSRSAR